MLDILINLLIILGIIVTFFLIVAAVLLGIVLIISGIANFIRVIKDNINDDLYF